MFLAALSVSSIFSYYFSICRADYFIKFIRGFELARGFRDLTEDEGFIFGTFSKWSWDEALVRCDFLKERCNLSAEEGVLLISDLSCPSTTLYKLCWLLKGLMLDSATISKSLLTYLSILSVSASIYSFLFLYLACCVGFPPWTDGLPLGKTSLSSLSTSTSSKSSLISSF